ncbi:hypothetical protein [uncultured Devosia sp.]|uniref:hypothetical protein n=1 Tax=uncultured Devosia sp. TaxID=211434 RepID=UPI0035CC3825
MEKFRYRDDVDAWLAPMNYEEFWRAIKPHCLVLEYRSVCDAKIETGQVPLADILFGLKAMAAHELSKRHRLTSKPGMPWLTVVPASFSEEWAKACRRSEEEVSRVMVSAPGAWGRHVG